MIKEEMTKEMKDHVKELLDKKDPIVIIVVHKDGAEWWGNPRDLIGTCEYVKTQMLVAQLSMPVSPHAQPKDEGPSSYHG